MAAKAASETPDGLELSSLSSKAASPVNANDHKAEEQLNGSSGANMSKMNMNDSLSDTATNTSGHCTTAMIFLWPTSTEKL